MVEIDESAFLSVGEPSQAPPPGDPLIDQLLNDRYRIERLLGAGGMGKVYAARHLVTGQQFAIKMLHPQHMNNDEARKRFEREAKAVSAIEHPHIVELYDYGQTADGIPFLVMEYMAGSTLRSFLNDLNGPGMSVSQAVSLALQMAQALQHVHERGIIHRDIKPDNIQIEVDGEQNVVAKLFDFGIARILSQEALTQLSAGPPGTLAYAAPEMYERIDYLRPAIDVYALGVTLFEILTGERPFVGSGVQLLLGHLKDAPPRVSERRQDVKIPPMLDALINRMLEKPPEQRPTMAEVSDSLAALLIQLPSAAARGLHNLRTYVLPKRLPRRPSPTSLLQGDGASNTVAAQGQGADSKTLTQIETSRQAVGAKIERESRSIIKRIFRQTMPADVDELLRRCAELESSRSEVELDVALLHDTQAQEKAAAQTERQELRKRMHGVRDELRAVTTALLGMPGRDIAKELAALELAYSAPTPQSQTIERLRQQESLRHRLSVELIDVQRELAEKLLQAMNRVVEETRKSGGRADPNIGIYLKRLSVILGELDVLDESLVMLLMPESKNPLE